MARGSGRRGPTGKTLCLRGEQEGHADAGRGSWARTSGLRPGVRQAVGRPRRSGRARPPPAPGSQTHAQLQHGTGLRLAVCGFHELGLVPR